MAQKITDINWDWVASHINDDPIKLRLKKDAVEHMLDIVQIECRKKAGKKLSSTLEKNPRFIFGNTLASEQSTSDMLALYHASLIPEGAKVCDLTSGLGIDVLHLAQRASSVTAIELQKDLCEALEINSQVDPQACGKVKVICGDCRNVLKELREKEKDDERPFDVIFIDPARRSATGKRLFSLHDCQPDVVEMLPLIQQSCVKLIIKMSPMLDITQVCRELPDVSQIIVLGTNRECKELIAICEFNKIPKEEPEISVVTLSAEERDSSSCSDDKEIPRKGIRTEKGKGLEEENTEPERERSKVEEELAKGGSDCGECSFEGKRSLKEESNTESNSGVISFEEKYPLGDEFISEPNNGDRSIEGIGSLKDESYIEDSSIEGKNPLDKDINRSPVDERNKSCPLNEGDYGLLLEEDTQNVPESIDIKGIKGLSTEYLQSYGSIIRVNKFSFYPSEESSITGVDNVELKGDKENPEKDFLYLYEPSPSMMKAGAYQLLAKRFSLKKMAPNSHLYLSDRLEEGFSGTVMRVRKIYPLNSSTIKALAKQNLKGEVAVRNYSMAAEALRKKLKVSNGVGNRYMATTTSDGLSYLFELSSGD